MVDRRFIGIIFILFSVSCSSSQVSSTEFHSSPSWARSAVWYQIFPERFRNGDTTNDPVVSDLRGSWPHAEPVHWRCSPWSADWYRLQPWEEENKQGFYFNAQLRRYGGDIAGILRELDYLANLGITAIYLNPMFQSPSLHKYDAATYHHIDKNFGPDPAGDQKLWSEEKPDDPKTWRWTSADTLFLRLIKEIHKRGMKVVLDGVFNHVGMTFWAFQDVVKNQERSPYKDWFTILHWDDPATPENEFRYQSWYDVAELPEWRKTADGIAPGPSGYIHAIVRRWMDPNNDGDPSDGIDGWRLDAADKVPLAFWRQFRSWVRAINPDAYITGEIYWEDWANDKMFNAAPWLTGDAFDAVMNYRWAREVYHYFLNSKDPLSATEFSRRLESLLRDYPDDCNAVLMNLLDSHDTDRLLSHILNHDLPYDKNVGLPDNREYDISKPGADEIRVMKMLVLFQIAYTGAPMVYYGDENGMWGGDDPDCRKPMLWFDLTYDDETAHPFGRLRAHDKNVRDLTLYSFYRRAIALRKEHAVLSNGAFTPFLLDDKKNIYSFIRTDGKDAVVALFNNSGKPQEAVFSLPKELLEKNCCNLVTGEKISIESGVVHYTMPAKSALLIGAGAQ